MYPVYIHLVQAVFLDLDSVLYVTRNMPRSSGAVVEIASLAEGREANTP
jgi:hypothetical protein